MKCKDERRGRIGETRHATVREERWDGEAGRARGVLRGPVAARNIAHVRRAPSADLQAWIAHFWMVSWDAPCDEPYIAETLPHPNIHLVIEEGKSVLSGVHAAKFSRTLEGKSAAFGTKFRAGAFRPFVDYPMSRLANKMIAAKSVFGSDLGMLERVVLSSCEEEEKFQAAEEFWRARLPEADETAQRAGELVECIRQEPGITTVDDLCGRVSLGKRSLQRLFSEYVGASPKWVIRRYRLHELLERCHSGNAIDWSQTALDLGYFDQAHLINDFQSMVGYSPLQYRRLNS